MAPDSPTHAFDPTPALEKDLDNFSPLNQRAATPSLPDDAGGDGTSKTVRFSHPSSMPSQGRHSIATTTVPLLTQVPSASAVPKHLFTIQNPKPGVDITLYMDQCRRWNTQLREAHDSERKAWEIERTALKARITELEMSVKRARDPKRRSSNDSYGTGQQSLRSQFPTFNAPSNGTNKGSILAESGNLTSLPVWKGPEFTPPVTRVFSNDDDLDINHLPSISENEPMDPLAKEVSPVESVPVPIEQLDSSLDGITLKSSALTSSFNKVTSPLIHSPLQSPSARPSATAAGLLQVDFKGLLSPLDEKLKRHAGHTPMAFNGTISTSSASSERVTPRQEKPAAPVPTRRPPLRPSENSDSYFSFTSEAVDHNNGAPPTIPEESEETDLQNDDVHDTDDDPALTGPLMLDAAARSEASNTFLEIVDAKLSVAAARRSRKDSLLSDTSPESSSNAKQPEEPAEGNDEEAPMLKIKNSMNFGSAWGGDMPGRI
ncbi:hypothetical protein PV10_05411 [Exophiala mesophila]|uniref:Uncharacterized protein n=1 Tax=Exophiala mesophila TaxID=212818 RepID=A0A0D1Z7N1_EXOME|nr:uncharacterized protein PV10_05411 [Exophiala mesophila]KIV90802.1 hypothetical protein PV10_05411 [Exophiala mesophila]